MSFTNKWSYDTTLYNRMNIKIVPSCQHLEDPHLSTASASGQPQQLRQQLQATATSGHSTAAAMDTSSYHIRPLNITDKTIRSADKGVILKRRHEHSEIFYTPLLS